MGFRYILDSVCVFTSAVAKLWLVANECLLVRTLGASMEVGAKWKADLQEDCSLEQLVQQADTTLMQVKGKRVTKERDLLDQACFGMSADENTWV